MYEYKVIETPVPAAKGWFGRKKSTYAQSLSDAINEMAVENWEFQRAEHGPTRSAANVLIFRRRVAKADENMDAPKSFADRMNEAEARNEDGHACDGLVRPRRARMIMNDAGTLTERPKALPARIEGPKTVDGTARRVTPMKPSMAAAAV